MNLRRGTTAAALLAATLASIAAPGWSETLRLQGYGDYVDLSLALSLPDSLMSGTSSAAGVLVANEGPGTAESPIVLLSVDAGVQVEGVSGCVAPTTPQRTCLLPAIAAGTAQLGGLMLHADPFARGTILVGAAVSSEAIEVGPGDEIRVVALPVVAEAETRVALLTEVPEVLLDGRLAWTIRVDNDGPSAAISPWLFNGSFAYGGPVSFECAADGVASCPADLNYVGPGSGWLVRLVAPPLSEANPLIQLNVLVQAQEPGNDYLDDSVFLIYRDALFSDGVE